MTERSPRIAGIFLPGLPIERWVIGRERMGEPVAETLPTVLSVDGPHGPVVHDLNRAARLAGVRRAARVVDMRAICPELQVHPAEPGGDAAALGRLMFWARRWGPYSATDGDDGLVVDTTGVAHLFGGEAGLLADMQAAFARCGLTARLALAPTRGAAWGLARFGPDCAIATGPADLHELPVAALRLSSETLVLLGRLGLKRIGDLAAIPRASLKRRFVRAVPWDNPLIRLDQAFGHLAEPVSPPDPPPAFVAQVRLAEAVMDPGDWLPGLMAELAADLGAHGCGCRRLCLSVFRVDGECRTIRVATASPTRDPDHLHRLFRDRLDGLDPGFGFDLIRLTAEATEPLAVPQVTLDGAVEDGLHLSQLVDRLVSRFGAGCVTRPAPHDSHIPERAIDRGDPMVEPRITPVSTRRPIRLFAPPEEVRVVYGLPDGPPAQFLWRRQKITVARQTGPERIAPEWWQDRPGTRLRDYFQIEDSEGRRMWLFREGLEGDGRGGAPRWFIHGVFA